MDLISSNETLANTFGILFHSLLYTSFHDKSSLSLNECDHPSLKNAADFTNKSESTK